MNKKQQIIIVDDDPDVGNMLKMIVDYNGYSGVLISSVEKLMNYLVPDTDTELIILDMLIAGYNGADVCRELKADANLQHIPILMFSALPDGKELAMQAGADDFIPKPFEMKAMIEKIGDLLHAGAIN